MAIINKFIVYDAIGNPTSRDIGVKSDNISFSTDPVNIGDGLQVKDGKLTVKFGDEEGTVAQGSSIKEVTINGGNGVIVNGGTVSLDYAEDGIIDSTKPVVANDSRLSDTRDPKSHTSSSDKYGIGTNYLFGHVKVHDSISSTSDFGENSGEVPSAQCFAALVKKVELLEQQSVDFKKIYPIGSIYLSYSLTQDPNTLFSGTTWVRIKERFLWAEGDNNNPGYLGGNKTHTLTVDEMPSHTHSFQLNTQTDGGYLPKGSNPQSIITGRNQTSSTPNGTFSDRTGTWKNIRAMGSTGSSKAFSLMPPYVAVMVWRRIS